MGSRGEPNIIVLKHGYSIKPTPNDDIIHIDWYISQLPPEKLLFAVDGD